MKQYTTQILYTILAVCLFSSCSNENEVLSPPNDKKFQSGNATIRLSAPQSVSEQASTKAAGTTTETVSLPFSEGYTLECSIEKIGSTGSAKAGRSIPLKQGVKYRILAYDSFGNIAGDKVLTVGKENQQQLRIPSGTYTFVAYSYNSTDTITDVFTNRSMIKTVAPPIDAMTYKVQMTVSDGDNYLAIDFRHLFSRVVVNFNAAQVDSATVESGYATITPEYSGTFSVTNSGCTMASTGTHIDQTILWKTFGTKSVTSDSTIVFTNGEKPTFTFAAGNLKIKRGDGTMMTNTSDLKFSFTSSSLQAGYSYKLTIILKKKITILVIADLQNSHGNNPANLSTSCGYVFKTQFANYDYQFLEEQSGQASLSATAKKWISGEGNGGNRADIVYMSYQAKLTSELQAALKSYLSAQGVLVLFYDIDTYGTGNRVSAETDLSTFLRNIFTPTITVGYIGSPFTVGTQTSSGGYVRPFPGNSLYNTSSAAGQTVSSSDPIMNNRYNVYNLQWGEDASPTVYVTGLPTDHLSVYSTGQDIGGGANNAGVEKYITGFRYQSSTINMVFFGDGGFTGGDNQTYNTNEYWRSPFAQTTNTGSNPSGVPAGRPNYGLNSNHNNTVYNSYVFCNIMQWAIDRSRTLRSGTAN